MVFDWDFKNELCYMQDLECGGVYIQPEEVEKLEVSGETGYYEITDDFRSGKYIKMNIWRREYLDTDTNRWQYTRAMRVTFTDEFMRNGKLDAWSEECYN